MGRTVRTPIGCYSPRDATYLLVELCNEVGEALSRLQSVNVDVEGDLGVCRPQEVRRYVQRINVRSGGLVLDASLENQGQSITSAGYARQFRLQQRDVVIESD